MRIYVLISCVALVMICSGCISGGDTDTLSPTTVSPPVSQSTLPPSYDTTPLLASEALDAIGKLQLEYQTMELTVSEKLHEAFHAIRYADGDYIAINNAYMLYEDALLSFIKTQNDYLTVKILLEHTDICPENDTLLLRKDTLPFGRPDGNTYSFGELNMAAEEFMCRRGVLEELIEKGKDGKDMVSEIDAELEELQNFLEVYEDISIGYCYRALSKALFRQAAYSDILIRDCNPECIRVS